ncbi:MAG: LysR family transcriptional regulator [Burkholderiales bacterium]|nr:LysR family transcriptional regulator [Burkholderiales bacterium]
MKVTFHQLEVFECVARRLSFTRAAEELSLSQPTVSAQMRQLADEVGMPLFDHVGKTIALTDAGRELLAASRGVFDTWSRFEMAIADMQGLKRGLLRLACVTTAKYFVPSLLGPFCQSYPEVEVRLEIANRESLVERMRANLDDLYIMMLPPVDLDIEVTPFRDNPIVVVAPAAHPLAGKTGVPLKRLAAERFILREAGSGTRQRVEAFWHEAGFVPRVRMELGSNEAIKHAVAAGLGISILSHHALDVDPAVAGLAVLDVEGFPLDDDWYFVHLRGRRLSVVARAFHDHVIAEMARLRQLPPGLPQARAGSPARAGGTGRTRPATEPLKYI